MNMSSLQGEKVTPRTKVYHYHRTARARILSPRRLDIVIIPVINWLSLFFTSLGPKVARDEYARKSVRARFAAPVPLRAYMCAPAHLYVSAYAISRTCTSPFRGIRLVKERGERELEGNEQGGERRDARKTDEMREEASAQEDGDWV